MRRFHSGPVMSGGEEVPFRGGGGGGSLRGGIAGRGRGPLIGGNMVLSKGGFHSW
jgi:hypothetical protein